MTLSTRYPEERRIATVLFADIQGFTELSERMDFEAVSDLIKEVWLRVDTVIEEYSGYIDKHIGDAVMAVWGAPYSHEDDAERAVAAALALQQSLADYTQSLLRTDIRKLKMRVGINTGWVMSSYVGRRGEYTMMGDTVNVASRLEQQAEGGTVVIGDSTYRLVRGMFRVRRLAPLRVKGKTGRLQAFVVEGTQNQPSRLRYRGAGGLETRMVGRDSEMVRLMELYQASRNASAPMLVIVRGEAGLGKSRLLLEFTSQLEENFPDLTLLSVRALAQASRVPFFIWKLLWYSRFGLSDNDPPNVARRKFARGIRALWGELDDADSTNTTRLTTEAARLIGNLIGLEWPDASPLPESSEEQVNRAFELTRELLCRLCANGPAVLLIDDLHWADEGSLNLLKYLLEPTAAPLPLLILGATRPGFLRQQLVLLATTDVIRLTPLPISVEMVVAAYPSLRYFPRSTLAELARQAEGNPYFLEEMVKSLVYAKAVGGSQLPGPIAKPSTNYISSEARAMSLVSDLDDLPEVLHTMLQARLDALSPQARNMAMLASVVGRVFWVGAVLAAAQYSMDTGLWPPTNSKLETLIAEGLAELVRAELAFPRTGTMFAGDQEYIFKHSLLRDVAYASLPHKHRRQYHLAVAHWLTTYAGQDFAATVAEHLEQAGALADAAQQYARAARYALLRGAEKESMWLREHALELEAQLSDSDLVSL